MWPKFMIVLMLLCSTYSLAFKIHDSCKSGDPPQLPGTVNKINKIITAAKEAVNMAQNAVVRADFSKNPGTMMMDLFGDDSPATYQAIKQCYQDATQKTGTYSESDDENLLIYCGSAHMKMTDRGTGTFRDRDHNNIDVRGIVPAANSEDACSSNAQAFGYPTLPGKKPGFIVVICQSAFDKSAMDETTNLPQQVARWRSSGVLETMNVKMISPMVGIDLLESYLSMKVLHEMMHVGDCIKLPSQLPESKKREQYGYHRIMARDGDNYVLSPTDKQSNADSYTFAAGVWYLPRYYSDSGNWAVVKKVDRFTPIDPPQRY